MMVTSLITTVFIQTIYIVTAVFNDGRFGLSSISSLFQNVSCTDTTATSLNECDLIDKCQSKCQYPIGLRCYGTYSVINELL